MNKCIYHQHHIIPRHAGGTDDPSNIVKLTVEEHAEAHRLLYEEHGRWQDRIAWLALSGLVGQDEIYLEVYKQRKGEFNWYTDGTQNWKLRPGDPRIEEENLTIGRSNFTFSDPVQRSKNISAGVRACGYEPSAEQRIEIGKGRRGKPGNVTTLGTKVFNDGVKCYYLKPDDPKIQELGLVPGNHKNKNKKMNNNQKNSVRLATAGSKWYNDGKNNYRKKDDDDLTGLVPGRLGWRGKNDK